MDTLSSLSFLRLLLVPPLLEVQLLDSLPLILPYISTDMRPGMKLTIMPLTSQTTQVALPLQELLSLSMKSTLDISLSLLLLRPLLAPVLLEVQPSSPRIKLLKVNPLDSS